MTTLKTISEEVHTIQEISENILVLINENIKIEIQRFYDCLWANVSPSFTPEEWNKLSFELLLLFPDLNRRFK